jgi:hypothetical protein
MNAATIKGDENNVKQIVRYILDQQTVPIRFITDLSLRDPYCSLLPESSLLQALETLSFREGVRRVAITEGYDSSLRGILSQSDITKFLASHVGS